MLDVQAPLTARSPDPTGFHPAIGVPDEGTHALRGPLHTRPAARRPRTAGQTLHVTKAEQVGSLSFVQAVEAMKAGQAVRRACGRRLFVFIAQQEERFSDALGCTVFIGPEDVLATDWEIAGEAIGRR